MGLDNGIIIRNKNTNKEIEVCYWRKYWGLRDEIYRRLNLKEDELGGGIYILDADDVHVVIHIISNFIQNAKENNYGTTFWDWEDNHVGIGYAKDIERLTKLEMMMRVGLKNNCIVEFYDSY